MKRLFIRKEEGNLRVAEDSLLIKTDIGITGLSQEAGVTTISSALAFFFEEKGGTVSFTECRENCNKSKLLYDQVSMDKRFFSRNFVDVYECICKDRVIKDFSNKEKNIIWTLITPEDREKGIILNSEQKSRLIKNGRGNWAIFDVESSDTWNSYLMDMDLLLVVVDPSPAKMIGSLERFRHLKKMEIEGCNIKWIVNKTNNGISRREIRGFLKSKEIYWCPALPIEEIYAAEYSSSFLWEITQIKDLLKPFFTEVSQ